MLLGLITLELDGNGAWLENELVACGPRSIQPTIKFIAKQSAAGRGGPCHLSLVLSRLGRPAHEALLHAIDAETNDRSRVYLIAALHNGFHLPTARADWGVRWAKGPETTGKMRGPFGRPQRARR